VAGLEITMPDTGAPWNIPYVAPTDNPRVYPAADEAQALAIAAGLDAAAVAGIGSNVVQVIKTDTFTSTSTSFTAVTGMAATITPTTNTSKILIIVQVSHGQNGTAAYGNFKVTGGNTATYVGDTVGNRISAVFGGFSNSALGAVLLSAPIVYLDSPTTTSPTTYQLEVRTPSSSVFINRSATDTNSTDFTRGASSITLIEVAP